MNILILSWHDMAGGTYALERAINETFTEHAAISARWNSIAGYPGGIWRPSPARVCELVEWADVLFFQSKWWGLPRGKVPGGSILPQRAPKRPIVTQYRGRPYRNHFQACNERDRRLGIVPCCNFLDLAAIGGIEHWVPNPVWSLARYKQPHAGYTAGILRVVQCPVRKAHGGWQRKNTRDVIRAVAGLERVDLEIISDVSHEECLQRKGQADVLVDQFTYGYGNNGLEAWAMGTPVIGHAPVEIVNEIEVRVGYHPFVHTRLEDLRATVERMRDDRAFRHRWTALGMRYVREHHAPAVVAQRAVDVCQEAIG